MTIQSEEFMKQVDVPEKLGIVGMSTEDDTTFSEIVAERKNHVQQAVLLDAEENERGKQTIKLPRLVLELPEEERVSTLAVTAVVTSVSSQKDSVSLPEVESVSHPSNDVQKRKEEQEVMRGRRKNLRIELKLKNLMQHYWSRDPWLMTTFLCASLASIASLIYYFQNHQILLMNDSYSHMLIARRVFDNLTPGITQLGGIWLPLPHILMLPFVWNNYLWDTGLAGSFVSMPCYVIAAVYLFRAARRLTHNDLSSFIGTLLFILNPNILYIQTTPLSEPVLIAAMTVASYYFLAWAQEDTPIFLIGAAGATFLATLARYDGWPLFIVFLLFIVAIGWLKQMHWEQIEGNLLLFGTLGGLGIVLWLLWNLVIFSDPLYFQHSEFSSQAQQLDLPKQLAYLHTNILIDYHNVWQSIRTFSLDTIYTIGGALFFIAIFSIVVFFLTPAQEKLRQKNKGHKRDVCSFIRQCITPEMVAAAVFLVPFAFYVLSLYTAQSVIFVPGAAPYHAPRNVTYYNVRYGLENVAPAAIFLAALANCRIVGLGRLLKNGGRALMQVLVTLVIVVQSVLIANGGIITLQDSLYGLDCASLHPVVIYLVQHYEGGRVLEDLFITKATSLESDVGIDFRNIVYEGSGPLWKQALRDPGSQVEWVLINPSNGNDLVAKHINVTNEAFQAQFKLEVKEEDGLLLFHKKGLPPLPSRPLPPGMLSAHSKCTIGGIPAPPGPTLRAEAFHDIKPRSIFL
ncbi:MAG: hypothetical protein H0W02_09530 [Ktedonobacteraceae bacterium]|nr:hypothetical protein [Ktedonobacteraceae bacterium]